MTDEPLEIMAPSEKSLERLAELWGLVAQGSASPQERLDAAWMAGELGERSLLPRVKALLEDEDGQVRYYALQALVIDLGERTPEMTEVSWKLLETDPDEDVQSMAASCLSSIYFGQRKKEIFRRTVDLLRGDSLSGYVKGGLYGLLHKLAGLPPREWPGLWGPRKVFEDSDIDWEKVGELEMMMTE